MRKDDDLMSKEKYLNEFKKRLSLLDEGEIQRIEAEYLRFFDEKEKEGWAEEEILQELGNVNELAKKILQMYRISPKYIRLFVGKEKLIDEFNDYVSKVADTSMEVFDKVEQSVKRLFKKTIETGEKGFHSVKKFFSKKEEHATDTDTSD